MRKSKNRKMEKKVLAKANIEYKKNKKVQQKERNNKYMKWLELPPEQWTEARKNSDNPIFGGVLKVEDLTLEHFPRPSDNWGNDEKA